MVMFDGISMTDASLAFNCTFTALPSGGTNDAETLSVAPAGRVNCDGVSTRLAVSYTVTAAVKVLLYGAGRVAVMVVLPTASDGSSMEVFAPVATTESGTSRTAGLDEVSP